MTQTINARNNRMMKRTLAIQTVAIEDIVEYENNSRTHSARQVGQIAESIAQFGWMNPVLVDSEMNLIAGHGRLAAARKIGMTEVTCVNVGHVTDAHRRAYVIADNQIALNAEWDLDTLAAELDAISEMDFDLETLGFDSDFLDDLLLESTGILGTEQTKNTPVVVADADEQAPPVTVAGDIWRLGESYVLCGDSRGDRTGELLPRFSEVDTTVLDPPYECGDLWDVPLAGHGGSGGGRVVLMTDHMRFDKLASLVTPEKTVYHFVWDTGLSWYVPGRPLCAHRSAFIIADGPCWDSDASVYYDGKHRKSFSGGVGNFGGEYNYEPLDDGSRRLSSVYRESKTAEHRGNGKPVQWVRSLLAGIGAKVVYEPFGGTGSTLLAAPEGVVVLSVEIDPLKVDAIVRRWQLHTGELAVHNSTGRLFGE